MSNLKSQLEQVNKDIEALQANKTKIEKQISDSEVTYSVGDRFLNTNIHDKYILVATGPSQVSIINLRTGCFYDSPVIDVDSVTRISRNKFSDIICGNEYCFTRYWDARKKCKC